MLNLAPEYIGENSIPGMRATFHRVPYSIFSIFFQRNFAIFAIRVPYTRFHAFLQLFYNYLKKERSILYNSL